MRDVFSARGTRMFVFDSVHEMTEYSDPKHYRNEGGSGFVGMELAKWEKVVQQAESFWGDGLMVLEEFVTRLEKIEIPLIKHRGRRTHWNESEGDEFDWERARQGEAAWRQSRREETAGETEITVIIDTTTPYHMDSVDILWRGAAAIALVKILEGKGYRVEIGVVNGSYLFSGQQYPVVTACRLKTPSDPLDASSLINAVAGWFYRTATFTLLRTLAERNQQTIAGGLGGAYSCTQVDIDQITPDDTRIYSTGVFSFSGACDLMVAELNKIAVDPRQQKSDV